MKLITGTPKTLRKINKDSIKQVIRNSGPLTKIDISKKTGLSLVTVSKIVEKLLAEGVLLAAGNGVLTGGRSAQEFIMNSEQMYFIGLYFHRETFYGVVSNFLGDIIYRKPFLFDSTVSKDITNIFSIIDSLIEECKGIKIGAIGIGVPGIVHNGVIRGIPTIPTWESINLKEIIEDKYNTKAVIANDINTMVLGEYQACHKNKIKDLVLIYLEKGVGSGIIINGRIHEGNTDFAGEIAYMPIYDSTKQKYEIFENLVIKYKGKLHNNEVNYKSKLLDSIAIVITNIVTTINPEIIIIQDNQINKSDLGKLELLVSEYLSNKETPKIILGENLIQKSVQGMIDLCIYETRSVYYVSDKIWD